MIYAVTMYCDLGPKLGLVVRKCLASLGIKSSEARWSSSSQSISEVKGYSDWNCNGCFFLWYHWFFVDQRRLLYWCGDTWKEHLSIIFVLVLLWSGIYSGSCTGTQVTNVSPSSLAWEVFRKVTLIAPQPASEASKVLKVKSWTSVRHAIRSTPAASPPRLSGRTGRDEYDACISHAGTD